MLEVGTFSESCVCVNTFILTSHLINHLDIEFEVEHLKFFDVVKQKISSPISPLPHICLWQPRACSLYLGAWFFSTDLFIFTFHM